MSGKDYASVMADQLQRRMREDEMEAITEETMYHRQGRDVRIDPLYTKGDAFAAQQDEDRRRFQEERRREEHARRHIVQPTKILPNGTILVMPNE